MALEDYLDYLPAVAGFGGIGAKAARAGMRGGGLARRARPAPTDRAGTGTSPVPWAQYIPGAGMAGAMAGAKAGASSRPAGKQAWPVGKKGMPIAALDAMSAGMAQGAGTDLQAESVGPFMEGYRESATAKGMPIAAFDAAAAGMGGRQVPPGLSREFDTRVPDEATQAGDPITDAYMTDDYHGFEDKPIMGNYDVGRPPDRGYDERGAEDEEALRAAEQAQSDELNRARHAQSMREYQEASDEAARRDELGRAGRGFEDNPWLKYIPGSGIGRNIDEAAEWMGLGY